MIFRSPLPDVRIPEGTLTDFVLQSAGAHRERVALVDGLSGHALTYGELIDQVRRLAAGLSQRGIGKGSVVSMWAPNLPEWAVVFHAVARLGAILTTANPAYTSEELAAQLKDSRAVIVITTAALVERARLACAAVGHAIEIITIDAMDGVPSLAAIAIDADPPQVDIDPARDIVVLP
jgi:acyl-CoA synthetase (AMP-forming)/AMP-acid ligase II